MLRFVFSVVVLALSCWCLPALEAAFDRWHGDAVSIDAVSMIQTMTVARTQRHSTKSGVRKVSTSTFKSVSVPYKHYSAERHEISYLPEKLSIGQLLAYTPTKPKNSDLFVFLPGSWAECANYTQLLETVAASMKALCLPYDNVKAMYELCQDDSECWMEKRVDASSGSFEGVDGNNIILRLQSALQYLSREHGEDGWGKFISGPTELRYDKMRVSGHSQGAGGAAMLAYQNKVGRVIQFSGPCDPSDWARVMGSATPSNRFFGMASYYDRFCDWESRQVVNWNNEGIISEESPAAILAKKNLTSFDASKTHTIISMIKLSSKTCKFDGCWRDHHDTTALNKWDHSPYADGLWQKLVGI